jgi:hypothetical protein
MISVNPDFIYQEEGIQENYLRDRIH